MQVENRQARSLYVRSFVVFIAFFAISIFTVAFPVFAEDTKEEVVSVTTEPAAEASYGEGDSVRLLYLKAKNGETFILPDEPITETQKKILSTMEPKARADFEARRLIFLKSAMSVLRAGKYVIGAGVYSKDKVVQTWQKARGNKDAAPPQSIAKLGHANIQNFLQNINQSLFENAKVVAEANEFGVYATGGGIGGGGARTNGFLLGLELGVAIGYNPSLKQVAFEIFMENEKFGAIIPFGGGVEARARLGMWATHTTPASEGAHRTARVQQLPFSIVSDSPSSLQFAVSAGMGMGLPALWVETHAPRLVLIRGQASPKGAALKGTLVDLAKIPLFGVAAVSANVYKSASQWASDTAILCWAGMKRIAGYGTKKP